jgi:hypothetical protein
LLGWDGQLDVRTEDAWQANDFVNRAFADSNDVPL